MYLSYPCTLISARLPIISLTLLGARWAEVATWRGTGHGVVTVPSAIPTSVWQQANTMRTYPKMLSCVPFSTPIVLSLPVYPFGWMACFGSLVFQEASPPPCLNNHHHPGITFHSKFPVPFPRCQQSAHTCGEFDIVVHVPEAVTKDCEPRKLFLYLASQRRR